MSLLLSTFFLSLSGMKTKLPKALRCIDTTQNKLNRPLKKMHLQPFSNEYDGRNTQETYYVGCNSNKACRLPNENHKGHAQCKHHCSKTPSLSPAAGTSADCSCCGEILLQGYWRFESCKVYGGPPCWFSTFTPFPLHHWHILKHDLSRSICLKEVEMCFAYRPLYTNHFGRSHFYQKEQLLRSQTNPRHTTVWTSRRQLSCNAHQECQNLTYTRPLF